MNVNKIARLLMQEKEENNTVKKQTDNRQGIASDGGKEARRSIQKNCVLDWNMNTDKHAIKELQ